MAAPLTRFERRRVLDAWDNHPDWSVHRVAQATQHDWGVVKRILEDAGRDIPARQAIYRKGLARIRERNVEIRKLARTGRSFADIGRQYEITRQRVFSIVQEEG